MKPILLTVLLFAIIKTHAQGVFTNSTHAALQKVISDFPNNFRNIKGVQIRQSDNRTDYISNVGIPGSVQCIVSKHVMDKKENFSWNCILFESEKFRLAKARYSEIYNQITNSIIKVDGEKPFILNGKYGDPREEANRHSIFFQLVPPGNQMTGMHIELGIFKESGKWKIDLHVYDKQP